MKSLINKTILLASLCLMSSATCIPGIAQNTQVAYKPGAALTAAQWFSVNDQIVGKALITPAEKEQLEGYLAQGPAVLINPQVKNGIQTELTGLIARYDWAAQQYQKLPMIPQTQQLQKSWLVFFGIGGNVFKDYMKLTNNPLATSEESGNPLLAELAPRKEQCAKLKEACLNLEAQTRAQLGIAARR